MKTLEIIKKCFFKGDYNLSVNEVNSKFTATLITTEIQLPNNQQIIEAFQSTSTRDKLELSVEIENQEKVYCDRESISEFINELNSKMDFKDEGETITLAITIYKTNADRKSSIISITDLTKHWSSNGATEAFKRYENLTQNAKTLIVEDPIEDFYIGDVLFTNDEEKENRLYSENSEAERDSIIKKRNEVSHFANDSSFRFRPEDFSVSESCDIFCVRELFDKLKLISSLIFISNHSSLSENGDIYLCINGYRLYTKNIPKEFTLSTDISHDYYKIFKWVYSTGNTVDKIGLARNIITLHIKSNNLLSIEKNTITSIESSFQIYLKDNVAKYIELKNQLSDHIQKISEKVSSITSSYGSNFKNSIWTMYSFFATIFLVRIIGKNDSSQVINNEVLGIFFVFSTFSIFTMLFSYWEMKKEKLRFCEDYELLKKRYGDLLDPGDIEKILSYDAQYNRDIEYISQKSKLYTALWTTLVFMLGIFTYGFWHFEKHNQTSLQPQRTATEINNDVAQALIDTSKNIEILSEKLLEIPENYTNHTQSLAQPFNNPYLLLIISIAIIFIAIKISSKEDRIILWMKRVITLIGLISAFFSLFTLVDDRFRILKRDHNEKPSPVRINNEITANFEPPIVITRPENQSPSKEKGPDVTIFIPFEEASCRGQKFSKGVLPSPNFREFISKLSKNLSSCGNDENPVVLEVRGFSSSSEVKNYENCEKSKSSDNANLKIADIRRDNVVKILALNKEKWVKILSHSWENDIELMKKSRGIKDRTHGGLYSNRRGSFNRRVEISILKLGNCLTKNSEFLSPQTTW